jgi:hypothetical protein
VQTAQGPAQGGGFARSDLAGNKSNGAKAHGVFQPIGDGEHFGGLKDLIDPDVSTKGLMMKAKEREIGGLHLLILPKGELARKRGRFSGALDHHAIAVVSAYSAVDVKIQGGEKAVGLPLEMGFDTGGIVFVVEEGELGSYKAHGSLKEPAL